MRAIALSLLALAVSAGCCCRDRNPCAVGPAAQPMGPAVKPVPTPKAPAVVAVPAEPAQPAAAKPINATCPVLLGNPVNPAITTTFEGKVVGFCCPMCKAKFEKDPAKYSKNLP